MMMPSRAVLAVLAAGLVLAPGVEPATAEENIGTVSQPLVAGNDVSPEDQQRHTLVGITSRAGGCSGSLLNSEWVISAAHCFLDPNVVASEITIKAGWVKKQTRKGTELHILGNDVAIVRVGKPFDGVDPFYNMPVYTGDLFPGRTVTVFGRGINVLASGKGDSAVAASSDGKYRSADFQLSAVDGNVMTYGPNNKGAVTAAGDSGGPTFINAGGQAYLVGVGSSCRFRTIEGKPETWDWVDKVHDCSDAKVSVVWPRILAIVGSASCRKYAWRAVGAVEYAKYVKCDPATISGPRWSPDFDHHLNFCKGAQPAVANAEDRERTRISQECRITAGLPKGDPRLQIAQSSSGFLLTGTGYAVNARVIIRASDAAGVTSNITRNIADAGGNLFASIEASEVCTIAGPISFTAEDQDANNTQLGTYGASPVATGTCPPPAAGGGGGGSPIATDPDAFVGRWNMRMSDGVRYVLTLEVNGDKLSGTFTSPGKPDLAGTIAGSISHRNKKARSELTFSQPEKGFSSFGVLLVREDGTIEGTLDEASDGKSYTWKGTRAGAGGVAEEEEDADVGGVAEEQLPQPPDDGDAAGADDELQPPPDDDVGDVGQGTGGDFAGTWDMRNGSGTQFLLTMKVNGNRVTGSFFTPGRSKNKGSLRGRIKDNGDLVYDFEQPGIRVRGKGVMRVDGDTVDGTFTVGNKRLTWGGSRTNGAAAGDDFGAADDGADAVGEELDQDGQDPDAGADGEDGFAGTWNMTNSRGTPFVLRLKVRGNKVTGTFTSPGKPKNSGTISGRITGEGVMDYSFEQPRLRIRGQGRMTVFEGEMEGRFSVDNSAENYSWSGVRTAGGQD